LIIRKIIRIVGTRCQIFGGKKCTKVDFGWGSAFQELTALLLTPWLHIRGPISKRRGRGRGGMGKRRRKGGSKKGVWAPQSSPQIDATGQTHTNTVIIRPVY